MYGFLLVFIAVFGLSLGLMADYKPSHLASEQAYFEEVFDQSVVLVEGDRVSSSLGGEILRLKNKGILEHEGQIRQQVESLVEDSEGVRSVAKVFAHSGFYRSNGYCAVVLHDDLWNFSRMFIDGLPYDSEAVLAHELGHCALSGGISDDVASFSGVFSGVLDDAIVWKRRYSMSNEEVGAMLSAYRYYLHELSADAFAYLYEYGKPNKKSRNLESVRNSIIGYGFSNNEVKSLFGVSRVGRHLISDIEGLGSEKLAGYSELLKDHPYGAISQLFRELSVDNPEYFEQRYKYFLN
ncbi:hypothetical protein [Neptuniibacter sp. QD37_11]|uniref:hypothetical protein n=1 Tax=Neptuniibacter sp. QD37_11 TaxID=3398209 RepID=UPI0039F48EB0